MLVEAIRKATHEAKEAVVDQGDPDHHTLALSYENSTVEEFRWDPDDSRVHLYLGNTDRGAVVDSPVDRFRLTTVGPSIVELTLLEITTTDSDTIRIASRFQLLGG
jgi:hypothetical protein